MARPFLLVAAAWLLLVPSSFSRGLRVSSDPTSVQEPKRHDIPHLRQGPRPKNCQNSQCFNYDLFDCFHRTSAECNKDNYNIANPGEFPQFKSPAPTVTPPTKRPTVTKPVVLERSNHPIIVSLGRLPSGWQKAHPALMDQVKTSVRLFALQSLMNCKAGWDVPAEITGVTIVPGRIPGRLDSVLFSVQISAEIRGFADVIQGYVETCMEMGRGSLIQRLKALDPNVFANLSIITGSFDPLDVNNNPTLRPTDSVQQIEVAETFPPSPVVVAAIPSIPSVPAIPAPQFGEGKERDEGVEGGEGDDEGEDEGEGGGSLLAENMWLIGLAASSILLVFPCVMISRRAKKKREAAKVEAKKTAMMMNQLKSAGAPGGASGGSPDPLTQNVLDSLFGMSGNTASTGVSSASRPTPEPSASAGAIAALDSLIAVSAASKPSKPYAPAPKPPLASAPKNQLNQGYVPTRRNPNPRASNSRPVKANKRKNEAVGKKKPTRAELIAAQEEMWAKRAAAGQSASKLKATPKLQRSKSASKLKATPKLQRSKEIVRSKSQRRSSKEIVPFQPNSHQQSSKEIVPYRPSPQQQRQQRHHAAPH
ncbi:hypothetical protein THAOC_36227 [Thalassiosira oceanica]|uniref:Uncharacterized protein n=1 Tax=Thalassiosira oceanica TaxID=159749 RepID=K0RF73_THAOC|nr:hypothetical protein THAOC_36227 [Thalassiosira oceanica]|eukprot:EJK45172.1 hypothetical protein THAOC_36227 [Thalassiosira oceanica]